jgi:hypothetical protein
MSSEITTQSTLLHALYLGSLKRFKSLSRLPISSASLYVAYQVRKEELSVKIARRASEKRNCTRNMDECMFLP